MARRRNKTQVMTEIINIIAKHVYANMCSQRHVLRPEPEPELEPETDSQTIITDDPRGNRNRGISFRFFADIPRSRQTGKCGSRLLCYAARSGPRLIQRFLWLENISGWLVARGSWSSWTRGFVACRGGGGARVLFPSQQSSIPNKG